MGLIADILKAILQAINDFFEFFKIDVELIKSHIRKTIDEVPTFNQFDDLIDMFTRFKNEIGTYEYPVISVTTPNILKTYMGGSSEIILLDFQEWAKYFIMVRAVMEFTIGVGFVMWVVKNVRVSFTLN